MEGTSLSFVSPAFTIRDGLASQTMRNCTFCLCYEENMQVCSLHLLVSLAFLLILLTYRNIPKSWQ